MDPRIFALLLLCASRQALTVWGVTDFSTPPDTTPVPTDEHGVECGSRRFGQGAKRAVGAAVTKLGLQLLEKMEIGPEQPNVILSPLSISLALSQLALGARNETEALLLASLHAQDLPCYHWALRELVQHLSGHALQVASRMYLKPGFELKQDFVDESLRIYSSEPAPLVGLEEVNQWVENATQGRVTRFLSSLPVNVVLMLVNAVHFKGEWQARFDPQLTSRDLFYIDSKNMVHVDMMLGPKYPLSVLMDKELGAQVARFPFKEEMSLLVVMPMSEELNVSAMAARLDPADLYDRLPRETSMRVKLPKFRLEDTQDLQEALTSMGMAQLFVAPDLSGIADGFLQVSSVQHKSSIELHEDGAEAAAATAVIVSRSNPTFAVNQPFFFALMDDTTRTPLFLGVVTNPNPGADAVTMQGDRPENVTFPHDNEFDGIQFSPPKEN
ncbi:alpha-2-antiplasmin-like [Paramormyrops kingsleyae]|uniref:Serpin family F member 2 n=2 Tax=Paramormyrops kingsleyae TaxID=1676925 RepID=A0A3B3SNE9_9TELE|nr:alpha-2-antiplasmin-like [Paramormyrops kingsleyae]XP_023646748.1 alpha-2-antiplasmin-like [Paramormyrops kingsleyae]XP_023646749.1 alpha-2-antiplasmin-like [Paramormyrops kingsleyae]